MRAISLLIIILGSIFMFFGCGHEGVLEGHINSIPYRMEVNDVLAVRGAKEYPNPNLTPGISDAYAGLPSYGISQAWISIYIGDDVGQMLTIEIYDMNYVYAGYDYPISSQYGTAYFTYNINNQAITTQTLEGGYLYLYDDGIYEGDKISGEFEFFFPEGTLYGTFSTKIGINY